jgi:hypothetical protein
MGLFGTGDRKGKCLKKRDYVLSLYLTNMDKAVQSDLCKAGLMCSYGQFTNDNRHYCTTVAENLNNLEHMTRHIESQASVPFYIAAGLLTAVLTFIAAIAIKNIHGECSNADLGGRHGAVWFKIILFASKLFDFMSDWAFFGIAVQSSRFTEYGAMGAQHANTFRVLQFVSLGFCILGTFAFAADVFSIIGDVESSSRRLAKSCVILLEDIPQIIICSYYLRSLDANFKEDSLAMVSIVFSGIFLLVDVSWVCCYCRDRKDTSPRSRYDLASPHIHTASPNAHTESAPVSGYLEREAMRELRDARIVRKAKASKAESATVAACLSSAPTKRCSKCNAKVQFCICSERRNTRSNLTPKKVSTRAPITIVNPIFTPPPVPCAAVRSVGPLDDCEDDELEVMTQALQSLDTTGRGYVQTVELRSLMETTDMVPEDLDELTRALDPSGTGRIYLPLKRNPVVEDVTTAAPAPCAMSPGAHLQLVGGGSLGQESSSTGARHSNGFSVAYPTTHVQASDDSLYDAVLDPAELLCQSHLVTRKMQCPKRQELSSKFCSNHTCNTVGCTNLKPSKTTFCNVHSQSA